MCKTHIRILLIILAVFIAVPANMGTELSFAGATEEKYFSQMTQDEKTRVLNDLIEKKVVPNFIKISSKTYSLSTYNWNNRGVITYGEMPAVNAANPTTSFPNYKDGQWRYLGYDMNGGLYGNDDFPPDYPSNSNPQNQAWLTKLQVTGNSAARNLIGGSTTANADGGYSHADKSYTASVFLNKNPKWKTAGWTASKIIEHFFFNAVLSDNGLTRGQFIGVKNIGSSASPVLRYQTFSVEVTVKFEIPPEIPEEPDPGLPTDPDPEAGEAIVFPPPPGSVVTVNCQLGLSPVTYAGHPAPAQDHSVFSVDGETWSAQRTYSEGFASNRFRAIGSSGTVSKITNTRAEVTFPTSGHYSVELEVRPGGGEKAIDVKPIEVKPTPTIIHSLTGSQKQNRKQVINLKVAKHPGSTLTEFWVKLEYLDKGESVTLHHKAAGGNTLVNSDSIKTRPIERLSLSDSYYEYCKLEFLVKNTEAANCCYTVYAKDSRGNSDRVTEYFAVSPDKPPEAAMILDGTFIRQFDSNDAAITVEDISLTDGDQVERTWFCRAVEKDQEGKDKSPWVQIKTTDPGYMDYSFGTGKKISFIKTGVGLFEVKLFAKDLWAEETLGEYMDEADRLAGEVVSASEVINIAPMVGLKALSAKSAEINILTGGEAEHNRVLSNLANMEQELLQQGIDARITVDKMAKAEIVPESPAAQKLSEVKTPFEWHGNWTFWEDCNFAIDNEKLYKISAAWVGEAYDALPSEPYTVGAWDALTGNQVWSSVFTDVTLPVDHSRNGSLLVQDDNEDYLFFTSKGKTLILTKDNGSILAVLDFEIGQNNFVEGDRIYTVKTDGIYAISTATGQIRKIYHGSILEGKAREFGGKVHFVANSGKNMYRGLFDLATESVSLEQLPTQIYNSELEHSHIVLGIDAEGKIIILTVSSDLTAKTHLKQARVYDHNNEMIFLSLPASTTTAYVGGIAPVYNEAGVCNYVSFTWDNSGSTYDYIYARVFDIYSGAYLTHYISEKSRHIGVSNGNRNPFTRELNGQVYVSTGADWVYVMNQGTGIYDERCKLFAFDPAAGTSREADINEVGIPLSTIEYGRQSDVFAVVQTGNNWPSLTNGSESHVISWNQPLQTVVNNHINKSFKAGSDINALIIYDETNPADSYTASYLDSLRGNADAKNATFILAARADIEEGGLGDAILSLKSEEKNTLGISVAQGQTGTISKTYKLAWGKTYYYEYEMKRSDDLKEDIFIASHSSQSPADVEYGEKKYFVSESFYEGFENKTSLNPFFAYGSDRISDGYYKGAEFFGHSNSAYYYCDPWPENATAIRFTIPPGRQGLLYLEYVMEKEAEYRGSCSQWLSTYIKIDGEVWNKSTRNSHPGNYSHTALLEPGEHEISFFASQNAHRDYSGKMWLDSIRVDLLSESEEDTQSYEPEVLSVDELPGGYIKIKGVLSSPPAIKTYGEVENIALWEGNLFRDSNPYLTWLDTGVYIRNMNFIIPAGKAAILMEMQMSTGFSGKQISISSPYAADAPDRWYFYNNASSGGELVQDNLKHGGIVRPGDITGTKSFTLSYSSSGGGFRNCDISYALVDSQNAGWQELAHFVNGAGSDKKFYLQESEYKDTLISFCVPQGNHLIKDFQLYSIENGVKVYTEKELFADSAKLSKWEADNATAAIIKDPASNKEDTGLIYKKGQLVSYGISYFDYEGDPAKKQYWKYTHTPFNDGSHPDAAVVLDADGWPVDVSGKVLNTPIDRFYVDGKYTVEHWQEDNTTRPAAPGGNPDYDKISNVVSVTFYVEGGSTAPWIKSIKTIPAVVKEGDNFRLHVAVDDTEKDELRLTTEVFYEKELIYIHRKNGIKPGAFGKYPPVLTDVLPEPAVTGKYEVVCTVRNLSGAGLGRYRFTVVSEGKISGRINHTDQWEKNRKKYNLHLFNEEYNMPVTYVDYSASKPPRKRGTNVFWSGERFLLSADVAGSPQKVTVEILGASNYQKVLSSTGKKSPRGETIYQGELWDSTMLNRWGKSKPQQVDFRFTAEYAGGVTKTFDDYVIVDNNMDYWLLHRLW